MGAQRSGAISGLEALPLGKPLQVAPSCPPSPSALAQRHSPLSDTSCCQNVRHRLSRLAYASSLGATSKREAQRTARRPPWHAACDRHARGLIGIAFRPSCHFRCTRLPLTS